jgi:hypothetical protein
MGRFPLSTDAIESSTKLSAVVHSEETASDEPGERRRRQPDD